MGLRKRILACLTSLAMVVSMTPIPAFAGIPETVPSDNSLRILADNNEGGDPDKNVDGTDDTLKGTFTKVSAPEAGKRYAVVYGNNASNQAIDKALNTTVSEGYKNQSEYTYSGFKGQSVTIGEDGMSGLKADAVWLFEDAGNGKFYLKNVKTGQYLNATYSSNTPMGGSIFLSDKGESTTKWTYAGGILQADANASNKYLAFDEDGDINPKPYTGECDFFTVRSKGDTFDLYLIGTCVGEHTPEVIPAKDATCTETGLTAGKKCSVCGEVITEQTTIDALGHDWGDWTTTKEATCSEKGSQARTCKRDATHTDTQDIECLPHTEVTVPGTAPTCTVDGKTDGKKCSVCGTITKPQELIQAKGHTFGTPVKENVTPAACEKGGTYDEVTYCTVCNDELLRVEKTIEAPGHTPEVVPGKAATCTEDGLTDGSKCSVCGETIKAREVIPALNHNYGEWQTVTPAVAGVKGLEQRICKNDPTHVDSRDIAPLPIPLTVVAAPEAGGTVGGAGTYTLDEDVTLTATPAEGYVFAGWYLDGKLVSNQATATVQAGPSFNYTAKFVAVTAATQSGAWGNNLFWYYEESTQTLTIFGEGAMGGDTWSSIRASQKDLAEVQLKHLVIKEGVTSVSANAFDGCITLLTAVLPEGITSLEDFAFCDCSSLTSANLPSTITTLGSHAFAGCIMLTKPRKTLSRAFCDLACSLRNPNKQ